jgi:hypothetical protein
MTMYLNIGHFARFPQIDAVHGQWHFGSPFFLMGNLGQIE